ncbi:MAG: aminotransferase class III-fold pyridoxal phosphate-dependent enzyme [Planctomycetes bacterium]|nr:aminotransferase class III-fold pyridoxal phosphate-dependent enzyme [Planctomycetota bacterium]
MRGEGNYLFDAEGGRYLDFVSGFGSVNLGHNHPRVAAAVAEALRTKAPGFAQSAINPYAAALAESLIDVSPPGLEMVFFCNSGAESVEAALKLARAATGRSGLLCCQGAFHGKTLGALSVTANPTYQRPFEPLLPDITAVPYGDLVALEEALATRQFAALIVEPIQAEAGIITPPPGYLREAQRLCRQTDTLLIADEVQTGLGRTGLIFACERDGLEPDIMTLAKSLGGGLMPIGAMLCRRSLWREAYGTVHRFALHTSTFGGGSLACAAGLETLRVLKEEPLVRNAAEQGERMRAGLMLLWQEMFDSIGEVRGEGLLLGLDLLPIRPSIAAHWKRNDATGLGEYMVPGLDKLLENIQSVYLMQTLLSSFGIYTQVARSNPNVLRVQPPLGIEPQEVDHFLLAVGTLCRELRKMSAEMHGMITKTAIGMHDSK